MNKPITRRVFLQDAAAAAGAAGLTGVLGQSAKVRTASKRWQTAVGLNGFMSSQRAYGYKMDLSDVLHLIKSYGYDGVELVPWPRYPTTAAEARALKKQYDDLGLKIVSLQARSRGGSCGSSEQAKREKYLADVKLQVDMLHSWGCEFIGVWSGGSSGPGSEEYCKWAADTWARLTEYASERGMYVVTEPEPVMAIHTLELLQRVVD